MEKLRELPPFEFENWAVIALDGIPNKTQVGDMGIDGLIRGSCFARSAGKVVETPEGRTMDSGCCVMRMGV